MSNFNLEIEAAILGECIKSKESYQGRLVCSSPKLLEKGWL